ncbi:hypothetical protein Scep_019582 [Stephania cephalantha]|uniref:Uncharacterized protein n=1 Tax=Stephania cephalantha TaxID=152367 RepID=A0AAP0IB46_9MAGN
MVIRLPFNMNRTEKGLYCSSSSSTVCIVSTVFPPSPSSSLSLHLFSHVKSNSLSSSLFFESN